MPSLIGTAVARILGPLVPLALLVVEHAPDLVRAIRALPRAFARRATKHGKHATQRVRQHLTVRGKPVQHPARELAEHPTTVGERAADGVAGFAGSWLAVGLHAVWFALWLLWRLDINLLTLIVSLEAIFLTIFLLLSGERKDAIARARSDSEAGEVDLLVTLLKQNTELTQQVAALTQEVHAYVTTQPTAPICHAMPPESHAKARKPRSQEPSECS